MARFENRLCILADSSIYLLIVLIRFRTWPWHNQSIILISRKIWIILYRKWCNWPLNPPLQKVNTVLSSDSVRACSCLNGDNTIFLVVFHKDVVFAPFSETAFSRRVGGYGYVTLKLNCYMENDRKHWGKSHFQQGFNIRWFASFLSFLACLHAKKNQGYNTINLDIQSLNWYVIKTRLGLSKTCI